ncbi:HIT domain-containing protein [Phenylobacterium aquaticum]|uniref:HIT domain-containing protein n=1 Tax=Phenylobacterium aquaticum TaxID=1763816 RepID=UPI0026EADA46|nr:HIT domain-containing protein [Phenylobacterium aquaticum]
MFQIDPAFLAGSEPLGDLPLCHARLQTDARYPWIVLIPRLANARELEDLMTPDQARLMTEIIRAGRAVRALGEALGLPVDKLNVGALGNVTPQLHIHVVGRRRADPAWPGPVWGHSPAEPYEPDVLAYGMDTARRALGV